MSNMISKMKITAHVLVAAFLVMVVTSFNTSPASAFAGTLENGNMAYAQGSGFDKGEACNYIPGFTPDVYDAWHFVLTTRGATFQQSPTNPAIAVNLNFVFMRQDGSLFVIKSGAWVQTGKGAYTYTLVSDRIRMVQAGTVAQINGSDSGMRLSHTCPGTGTGTATTTSPTPTPTASTSTSASPSPTATRSSTPTASPTPTATRSSSPTASPTPTASRSASPSASASPSTSASSSPSASASASPTSTPTPGRIPTRRPQASPTPSAIQIHPTGSRSPLPTPTPTFQNINNTPTPTPSPTSSPSRSSSPTPSNSPSASPEPTNPNTPPVVPTPPPVEDPKNVVYVDPKEPTKLEPKDLPSEPKGPIEIVIPPKYGNLEISPTNEITYTPKENTTETPRVDLVELKYTNLAGAVVIVRKEFIVTQKGDVPKIIQTGYGDSTTNWLVSLLLITLTIFRLRGRKSHA